MTTLKRPPLQLVTATDSEADPFDRVHLSTAEFSQAVADIYEGPTETMPWSTALMTLRRLLNANWVALTLRPPSTSSRALIVNAGPFGAALAAEEFGTEYAFALDPFFGLPEGKVFSVDQVIPDARWVASDFYRQFVEPHNIRYLIGADFHTPEGAACFLRVCRPLTAGRFSADDQALLEALVPHLRQAVRLHASLDAADAERSIYAAAVDRMFVGSLILDEHGIVVKSNSVADAILAERDGLSLERGALYAEAPAEHRELQRLIGKAAGSIAGGAPTALDAMAITRPSGRHKLGVLVRSLPWDKWSEDRSRPVVAVFIRDAEKHSNASLGRIRQLFDLTPAEASLAILLVEGISLEAAAEKLGIRKNTARAHLRAIFSKTGVTRQTALIHLMLSSVASLG